MHLTRLRAGLLSAVLIAVAVAVANAQPSTPQFGGGYAELDARRQALLNDWVARLVKTTGQAIGPQEFYDNLMSVSGRITFEAVTHALQRIPLTDSAGASLGDALALVERIDYVIGEAIGAAGDHQFRMYSRLTPGARDTLARAREFKRGADNSIYHKGYPTNYREQGVVPSVQISIARDGRRADIDVDYRASSFPTALFNGHLTAANSDVRAGNNYDRHISRWTGFQKWWGGFFGVRQARLETPDAVPRGASIHAVPRLGKKKIDAMVNDFLTAWLVEGDIVASMGYVSDRAYACLARDSDNPAAYDRGMAPVQLMINMKAAHDALGTRTSLATIVAGAPLAMPALRLVSQPRQAQFLVYAVPDDAAAAFDCEGQIGPGDGKVAKRKYGDYFGTTFTVDGRREDPVALLWAEEKGYWKIIAWKIGADGAAAPPLEPVPSAVPARVNAEPSLVQAARGFLDSWLVKKNYAAAFGYLAPASYACYDLERDPSSPPSASPEDAGRKLRAGLEAAGTMLGAARSLDAILSAAEPLHPAVRIMNHQSSRVFSLASLPDALADAMECGARASVRPVPEEMSLDYGAGFAMNFRFTSAGGDAPVFRTLWRKQNDAWRITSYAIERP